MFWRLLLPALLLKDDFRLQLFCSVSFNLQGLKEGAAEAWDGDTTCPNFLGLCKEDEFEGWRRGGTRLFPIVAFPVI